jgi:predicted O-methyltransferase YrrM
MLERIRNLFPVRNSESGQSDLLAMHILGPLTRSYLPWTSSSLRPSALATILNDIVVHSRQSVVECGGGVSTFYIGRLLAENSGHLFTIEHDPRWATLLTGLLQREGLGGTVTVIFAPMNSNSHSLDGANWYDVDSVEQGLGDAVIDLLLVDGPLAYAKPARFARYPAVPQLRERLAADATIVLDDIHRRGEREIARRWATLLGISFDVRRDEGGIAIGRLQPGYHV